MTVAMETCRQMGGGGAEWTDLLREQAWKNKYIINLALLIIVHLVKLHYCTTIINWFIVCLMQKKCSLPVIISSYLKCLYLMASDNLDIFIVSNAYMYMQNIL